MKEVKQILEEYNSISEASVAIRMLKEENAFLKRQIETFQTFQAKMGLTLNKIEIGELFEKKILECQARDLGKGTIDQYKDSTFYFLKWCNKRGLGYADEVTRDHTHEFWNWFKVAPGKRGKIIGELRRIHIWKLIKATFQYAEERNSVIRNPFKNKVFPINPVKDWWTDEYYYTLIEAIRKYAPVSKRHQYETIVRGLYTTGLRIRLFIGAKHEGVTITNDGRIYVTTKRKVNKSSEIQEVKIEILNKKFKEMYIPYIERRTNEYVICTWKSPLGGARSLRRSLKRICKKAKIPYKSPHKAKHGFVTKMLIKGYTSQQICKMTGNSTPSLIDRIYNHIQASDFRERVKADIQDL